MAAAQWALLEMCPHFSWELQEVFGFLDTSLAEMVKLGMEMLISLTTSSFWGIFLSKAEVSKSGDSRYESHSLNPTICEVEGLLERTPPASSQNNLGADRGDPVQTLPGWRWKQQMKAMAQGHPEVSAGASLLQ